MFLGGFVCVSIDPKWIQLWRCGAISVLLIGRFPWHFKFKFCRQLVWLEIPASWLLSAIFRFDKDLC